MIDKIKTYVGFSIKCGKITFGTDNILECRKLRLIIYDASLSENASKKLISCAETNRIEIIKTDKLIEIVGRDNCKAVGIKDKNLSKAIISYKESF